MTTKRPKALFFDVFGTLVNWRGTVSSHLARRCNQALSDNGALTAATRSRANSVSWLEFSDQWRQSYGTFTSSYEPRKSEFKTVDQHHLDSLRDLTQQHGLDGLWTDQDLQEISKIWHFLDAWPDSGQGISSLNSLGIQTSTLSNGNTTLLNDLCEYASLPFKIVTSAEEFGAYKPHPSVYLGACEKLGFDPAECGLVAAHLADLQAADKLGLMTIYVERPGEIGWTPDQVKQAKDAGWVNVWVGSGAGEEGIKEVARIIKEEGVGKDRLEK